jgi:nucleotidyltransferase substrate binding protein (TIGR01987 family)
MNPYIRDGVIQRFEYTFELVWKSLQRHLKFSGVSTGSPKGVFRASVQSQLIENIEDWFEFLKSRELKDYHRVKPQFQEIIDKTGAIIF